VGKRLTLILGGARSGKSTYAQTLIEESRQPALFVATATAGDEEMAARIAAHRSSRPPTWITLEAPLQVGEAILSAPVLPWVLIDCMTMLTSNVLFSSSQPSSETEFRDRLKEEIEGLLDAYHKHFAEWVIVSNEIGLGLVPADAISRYYRDGLGWVNQTLAKASDRVIFMAAGIPVVIK
jgi:adenosylcobinamide kinase / adenosylcobinamide-phosphate guanylyltransferase